MSYSHNEAKIERALDIKSAVIAKDPNVLKRLAIQEEKEGNHEQADFLMDMYNEILMTAKEVQDEMNREEEESYKEEREAEYAEAHNHPAEGK